MLFGTVMYPRVDAGAVLRGWRDYTRTASDDVTTTARLFPAFGGPQPHLSIALCHAGSDAAIARTEIEPLLRLGTVIEQDITRMPYADVLDDASDLPVSWQPRVKNRFARDCSDDLIDTVTATAGNLDAMYVELRNLGGAFGRVPSDATAFAYRDSEVMLTTALLGSPEDNLKVAAEFDKFWRALTPFIAGAYGNFLSTTGTDDVASIYPPDTYARLAAVKRTYDPKNVFDQNHNIAPSR